MATSNQSRIASIVYNTLLNTVRLTDSTTTSNLWHRAWKLSCDLFSSPVTTTVHGRKVVLNFGHTYPLSARMFPHLNNPLIELVFQSSSTKQHRITLVDAGANMGDTILLLQSNCPEMVRDFCCIDGDPEFFEYLQENLAHLPNAKLFLALLASPEDSGRDLVRIHRGTSSAQKAGPIPSVTLDSLLRGYDAMAVDVLKIDLDGFDGRALLGAQSVLRECQPEVIFEWHPGLCLKTSNNWTDHFEALQQCGYTKFVWFTKYGDFSHFMENSSPQSIAMLAEFCLWTRTLDDWHYDVIALHGQSRISPLALADLKYALTRKSQY